MVSHKNYARLVCMGESWPWSLAHTAFVFCFCFFAQSSYKELISKVLNTFKPGRFLMTLFANEVSSTCSQVKLLRHVCKWTVIQILQIETLVVLVGAHGNKINDLGVSKNNQWGTSCLFYVFFLTCPYFVSTQGAPCGFSYKTFQEGSILGYKRNDLQLSQMKMYNLTYGHYEKIRVWKYQQQ